MFVTKIIAAEIVDKLPLDKLKQMLPSKPEICITYVATKKERKADKWIKDGKTYYRIILDYDMVSSNSIEEVLNQVKAITLLRLKA